VVKMSSLGDIVHTLPALTDASKARPGIRFDWVVEENFSEIPGWHPAVDRIIPVALRRWRRHPLRDFRGPQWREAKAQLRHARYDALIDAQGLVKSAFISRLVSTARYGLDRQSVRERLATSVYDHRIRVPREMHAVERTRMLFARALKYALPSHDAQYGLEVCYPRKTLPTQPFILFFHGSAVARKLWPESHWIELARLAVAAEVRVLLPWGSEQERQRAQRIAMAVDESNSNSAGNGNVGRVEVLPRLNLSAIADLLASASGMVAVDTGLGHLGAALGIPGVSLYGHTRPDRVGTLGKNQCHLRNATDLSAIASRDVWTALLALWDRSRHSEHVAQEV
jgi:heptosyltransferase-1